MGDLLLEEGAPTAQHQTPSTDTVVKSVHPSPRMRQIIQKLVNFARPTTGKEFHARHGTHVSLAMIAGVPWLRVERSLDGFFAFSLEDLCAYCAGYQLRPKLGPLVEELKRRRQEPRQWCKQTDG